jgi:hypothetical protein
VQGRLGIFSKRLGIAVPVTRKPELKSPIVSPRRAGQPLRAVRPTFVIFRTRIDAMPINLFAYDFLWVGELCLVERSGYCDLLRLPLTPEADRNAAELAEALIQRDGKVPNGSGSK